MMAQLGIRRLRPGPSGNENAPNHANYDEAIADKFKDLPDPLIARDGTAITTAQQWWEIRRPQIVEDLEREVYGRVPAHVPQVKWSVVEQVEGTVGTYPVIGKRLIGHVDNSACPEISVDIRMTLVLPKEANGPVPVMMMFGPASLPTDQRRSFPGGRGFGRMLGGGDPPATWQLIADGWGYAYIDPGSIQADNGAGLTRGIIGLTNKGQPRRPDDWGALRAWGWGASRGLDYLKTEQAVDANRVGIEGVSRYGKAALVAMAFDTRFAMALVGSSGAGGAKLLRRNFGEAVENLTGSGEYHWMAGNFLKYGAEEADFGKMDPNDLPVDAHSLIALCAPRLVFISYGVPEQGDARWVDQKGSFMAAVAAGKVYRLLGAKDLGVGDDYRNAKMPPVNQGLLDGQLAWRQHDGGHTDGPNWRYFIQWADRFLGHRPPVTADRPIPRTDRNSQIAHAQLLEKAKKGRIDVYFLGDSITRRWGATDYPQLLEHWKASFHGWNAANFGWGGDTTQNILWRIYNGELDGVNPKVVVLQAGTNNVGNRFLPGSEQEKVEQVVRGIKAIIDLIQIKAPQATIILVGIFPRNDNMAVMPVINKINERIASFADGKQVRYLNINDRLADSEGRLFEGVTDPDKLHLSLKGYQIWADALKPILQELLGPPGAEDYAPPPTGDPSKAPQS
ncbi:MAG: GDSL-type esterase/lipase family protein [Sedimentisphaerales bacterium]|nr:GDSL-type esterase/lipase family protein [Sedimentisphaerales bacterium]